MGLEHSPKDRNGDPNQQHSQQTTTTTENIGNSSSQQAPPLQAPPPPNETSGNILANSKPGNMKTGAIPKTSEDRTGKCKLCFNKNNRWMVSCDTCEDWYHYRCVGVNDQVVNEDFVCRLCERTKEDETIALEDKHSHSSKNSATLKIQRLEEERQMKLRIALEERRMQEKRDHEYALKIQKAEEEALKQKFEILELRSSSSCSSFKGDSLTRNWLESSSHCFTKPSDGHLQPKSYQLSKKDQVAENNVLTKSDLYFFEQRHGNTAPRLTCEQQLHDVNRVEPVVTQSNVKPPPVSAPNEPQQPTRAQAVNAPFILWDHPMPQFNTAPRLTCEQQLHDVNRVEPVVTQNNVKPPPVSAPNEPQQPTRAQAVNAPFTPWDHPMPQFNTGLNNQFTLGTTIAAQANGMLTPSQVQARWVLGKKDLPEFSGDPSEWTLFYNSYVRTTEKCGYSNDENLERLLKALKGDARKLVKARLISSETVPSVIESLRRRYGNPANIINELILNVRKIPKSRTDSVDKLLDLAAAVEDLVATIENSFLYDELRNRTLLNELVLKLPFNFQMNWTSFSKMQIAPDLHTFNTWLINIADTVCQLPKEQTMYERTEKRSARRPNATHRVAAHDVQKSSRPEKKSDCTQPVQKCHACSSDGHKITDCKVFQGMKKSERWDVVVKKWLCRICFGEHHTKKCGEKKPCNVDGCQKSHHALLHPPQTLTEGTKQNNIQPEVAQSMNHCMNNHEVNRSILYRILPVKLYGNNVTVDTYAFMDDGSSTTLLEKETAKQLKLDGPTRDLCIKWTADVSRVEKDSQDVSLEVSGVESSLKRYKLANIQTVDTLNLPVQTVNEHLLNFSHLRDLPITQYTYGRPTILIGMDQYNLCVPLRTREGERNSPIATETRLGWVLSGSISTEHDKIRLNFHGEHKGDDELHMMVKSFFSTESFGIRPGIKAIESEHDIRAKQLLKETTKLCGGRFETGLLWKNQNTSLPESRRMAERRLQCLEKKFNQDVELFANVKRKIEEYVQKGYARELTDDEVSERHPCTWYLPVFTVRNPNKPNKIRLVWDAAAKSHGISLNDALLKGPDMLNPLPDVLMRFREKPIAVGGDLMEMFHQVRINQHDQQAQRFLWRDDPNSQPRTFVMEVMTFGASCSPSSAHYVLRENANRFASQFPRAVMAIEKNHYVDDWLDSFGTVEEALKVVDQVTQIHQAGGFNIHNWVSSCEEVLSHLREKGEIQKCLSDTEMCVERVLGMHWRTNDDKFVFVINRNRIDSDIIEGRRTPTKREVLSTVMSTFDPLGLIASYVIYAKAILQEIWRSGKDWDDPIAEEQDRKWKLWTSQFKAIEQLEIPRCYTSLWSENDTVYELHVFVDASEAAYAATAYIWSDKAGIRDVALVASKTRVAPLRPTSIPRLELLAAVVGTRLAKSIQQSHTVKFRRRYMWTDSKTVLCWLQSDARKYRQFVALRIAEILEETEITEWNWVPTSENVADEATKWATTPNFSNNSRWYQGPEFLKLNQDCWPKPKQKIESHMLDEEEMRSCFVHTVSDILEPPTPKVENFSTWESLRDATLALFKSTGRWVRKVKEDYEEVHRINVYSAETWLFKKAQYEAYKDEISQLKRKGEVDNTSKILQFSPYVDKEGFLRMKGRIDNADGILEDTKRPFILPFENRITYLFVDFMHRKYLHKNHDTVINEVRQRAIIPKLKTLLKAVRSGCQKCKNDAAKPQPPEMGILPHARLQTYARPFSYVGLDYFGPLEVCVGRRVEKRYGALFTCMTSRGIHIEVTHSLTSDSCIMAVTRFMGRRGTPIEIVSDNATNFRGSSKELIDVIQKMSKEDLTRKFPEIKWTFIPPSSPHFGGTWERLVRSVKSNLYEILKIKRPSDEVLMTCLTQVENIVNSRPLTDIPIDDASAEALTPNHLIHGTSSGVKPFFDRGLDEGHYVKHWLTVEQMTTSFWRRFMNEYIPTLSKRTKWFKKAPPLKVGDIVIVVDEKNPRNTWPRGVIIDVNTGADGQTRSAVVKTQNGVYTKPAVKLAVLDLKSKQAPNSESMDPVTGGDTRSTLAYVPGKHKASSTSCLIFEKGTLRTFIKLNMQSHFLSSPSNSGIDFLTLLTFRQIINCHQQNVEHIVNKLYTLHYDITF